MKKILILAAAIVAGVAANAASFKWSAANIYGANGSKYTGEVTLMAYANGSTASDAIVAATFTPTTAGSVSYTFSSDDLVGGTTYNFYMVISDGGKQFTSAVKTVAAQATSTQNIPFGNMQSATQNASNWQVVPEPTSGLMLLLGVAGLALKRKRA